MPASSVSTSAPEHVLATRGADPTYLNLVTQARAAGLFHRSSWACVVRIAVLSALFAGGWAALFIVGNSWYALLVAVYLALVSTQIAFFGHDIGHRQVFRSRRVTRWVGRTCGNVLTGVDFGYWVNKHNQHHANPNQTGADPDVGPGVLSWTASQTAAKKGLGRVIVNHQAVLFFPLTLLEALNLKVLSARYVLGRFKKGGAVEAALLAVHVVAYLALLFAILSPVRAVAFLLLQQGIFGLYLGCAFAPNHKGMTMVTEDNTLDFVRRQVTTSRNVNGGRLITVALGGLNHQIEHHLFPTMPMANLARCRPLVRAYCVAHDIDYRETSLIASYVIALRYLRDAGKTVAA